MQRPISVTVFGILNIVFAAFGFFGALASVMLFAAPGEASNNPIVQIINENPGYAAYLKVSTVLGVLVSLLLLAAGIGLLKLMPWGRLVSIGYAIYAIIMVLVNSGVSYVFLVKPLMDKAAAAHGPEAAGATAGAIGGVFGGCFGLIYPILLLIFMFRPGVAAAFRPSPAGAVQPPPG